MFMSILQNCKHHPFPAPNGAPTPVYFPAWAPIVLPLPISYSSLYLSTRCLIADANGGVAQETLAGHAQHAALGRVAARCADALEVVGARGILGGYGYSVSNKTKTK